MTSPAFVDSNLPVISAKFRFQWEEAQGCYVLLYPEGMVRLNPSAGEILKRCNGTMNVFAIIDDLKNQFPDTDLEIDVRKFLEVANDHGWICFHSPA
ncbi:MAG: pyrroloquinoline quinone biosynthesis peptide chaperone PqqD [Acidobacteria bacterium]|nr:pyrroloquinoline quinone biosynthesis peptide chaperone PqqD [Acidobacteriota bacterium]